MGRHLGRLIASTSGVLVGCLAAFSLAPPVAAPAPSDPSFNPSSIVTSARALEPYLVRNADGSLSLNAPANVLHGLPAADVQALGIGLTSLNARIGAGELRTSPSGAVFNPKADRLTFQAGWTGYGGDWWHDWFCLSNEDIVTMSNFGWWNMTGAGLVALTYFAAAVGLAVSVVVLVYSGWLYAANNGNGSCLNFGHWPPPNIWVTSQ